jgi:SOS-response transcriptional repressor LexA
MTGIEGLPKRLKRRRLEMGFKVATTFCKELGIPSTVLWKLEHGIFKKSDHLPKIASKLNTTVDWLMTGQSKSLTLPVSNTLSKHSNAVALSPVIQWNEVPTWKGFSMELKKENYTWVPVVSVCSPETFSLIMDDDAMRASFAENINFPKGTIVTFDPAIKWQADKFVVAVIKEKKKQYSVFRKIVKIRDTYYLSALNSTYPSHEIDNNVRIVGTAIGIYTPL